MTNQAALESITLDTKEIDFNPHHISRKEVTLKFLQKSNLRSVQRKLRIFDDKILVVQEILNNNKKKFLINLSLLDQQPRKVLQVNFNLLYLSLTLIATAILLHSLSNWGVKLIPANYVVLVFSLLDTTAAISIIWLVYKTKYYWIFTTEFGRIPVIELLVNNPNKKHFKMLLAKLEDLIKKSKHQHNIPKEHLLPAILGEHRRLRDEGIISSEDYETAKANILGNHKDR